MKAETLTIAIYAAAIWAGAMDKRSYRTRMYAAYRRSALRVISAFRTASTDAAVAFAGMMLLRLVVDIEKRKHDIRRGTDLSNPVQIEDDAMNKWQQDSANSNKGRWTYRLIPNIGEWTKRRHGQVNFYLIQLLAGHGCDRAYLYKYGHDVCEASPECRNEREMAEHVFFTCPRCVDQRNCL